MFKKIITRRAALMSSFTTGALLLASTLLPQNVKPAMAAPAFQAPFYCGQTWVASTRDGHSPSDFAVDFNFYPADQEVGKKIRASANGTVIYAQFDNTSGYGRLVKIRHGSTGYVTFYAHLDSISVSVNQTVTKGDPIGVIGGTGNVSGPHLHYEQRLNGTVVRAVLNGRQLTYFDSYQEITSQNC